MITIFEARKFPGAGILYALGSWMSQSNAIQEFPLAIEINTRAFAACKDRPPNRFCVSPPATPKPNLLNPFLHQLIPDMPLNHYCLRRGIGPN